ncbi:hypothetical protein [Aureimonas pseudogalii]|uniref:DUF2059 domain-containing protein n=1 Tax=Aureimonas pseudogalii TaxID=1744844 RepID=A0A7W6H7S7_9HYPH|nr:hypothetical protein [Aureimonas pseudogalii]MBB4000205.1 hypothetical protein [Aureimonas pseudogalii]
MRWTTAALALVGVLAAILPGRAMADPAGDERYLRLEDAERVYAGMAEFARMQGPLIEVSDRRELPALAERGTALAAQTFAVAGARDAMLERLRKTPGEVPVAFDAIVARMRAVEAEFASRSLEALQAGEADAVAHYEARPDRASIDAVGDAMAAPDLARETAVTGLRVKWIYETLLTGNMDEMRAMTPALVETGIREVLDRTRAPDDPEYGAPPLRKELVREQARMVKRMVLSHLPEADVAALAAFYASDVGRAKRRALVEAFGARNDEDGARFIRQLLERERSRTP